MVSSKMSNNAIKPFSDEDFRLFVKALSDVFEVNHINDLQLWSWRNEREVMRAWRYAPVPEDCQHDHSEVHGVESIFSIVARRDEGVTQYSLAFDDFQCVNFDSLEALIGVMVGVVKSFKLSTKYSEPSGNTENEKFWLSVGDIVEHVGEPGGYGVVIGIDDNLIQSHGVTTCRIVWYDDKNVDVQWSNKLRLVENGPN